MATDLENLPSTPRQEYVDASPELTMIRDFMGGTKKVHARFKDYVSKYSKETPVAFKRRATAATVYGGLGRTLSASVGMLFAKPPTLEGTLSDEMTKHWANLDGKGTAGEVMIKRRSEDAIADGFAVILVDHPTPPKDVVIHAGNQDELNLRPLWAGYQRADVISWDADTINNVETLTQVVLREGKTTRKGRFGRQSATLYRVCSLGVGLDPANPNAAPSYIASWELLEELKQQNGEVTVVSRGAGIFRDNTGQPFDEIPLAICYGGRTDATLTAHPPLLDVTWKNLEHFRVSTNLRFYEDLCAFPQPTVEGDLAKGPNGEVLAFSTGPGVLIQTMVGSKFSFAELEGKSLDQLRQSVQTLKDEIAELGLSFLAKKTRGVETAEAKRLDATAENSTLATSAQGIQDGFNTALRLHARYLGIEAPNAPTVKINRDFEDQSMDSAVMLAYIAAVRDAGLPVRIMLEIWQAQGRIPADVDLVELEAEMMAQQAAVDEQKRLDAAALKGKQGNQLPQAA